MPDPVCILDGSGEFLDISEKAVRIIGYTKEELIGKNVFSTSILTKRAKVITLGNLAKRMIGIQVAPYVTEIVTKDKKNFGLKSTRPKSL
jgi:PAS domain S-box-containing protein